jgi:Ras GTPase-activating-like protein IQGAP2/3
MDQYIALSKKNTSLIITLNEIYSMHSLLSKYLNDLVVRSSLVLIIHVAYS